jgi:hypothetical protein
MFVYYLESVMYEVAAYVKGCWGVNMESMQDQRSVNVVVGLVDHWLPAE